MAAGGQLRQAQGVDRSKRRQFPFTRRILPATGSDDGRPALFEDTDEMVTTRLLFQGTVVRKSKANFVDLAGSERLAPSSTSMSNADRMAETKTINKSLTYLGTVILQLANGSTHIGYRNSVLTR